MQTIKDDLHKYDNRNNYFRRKICLLSQIGKIKRSLPTLITNKTKSRYFSPINIQK